MRHRFAVAVVTLLVVAMAPVAARANARLVSVTPVDGACVSGPTGAYVEAWDVVPGGTYVLRLEGVTDCANEGTDPTINVLVKNSAIGNTPAVATKVATGVYEFTFTMSQLVCETSPILYCTAGGNSPGTGLLAWRHDTGTSQAHLRAAEFGAGCARRTTISCVTGTGRFTWGALKSIYR